MGDKKGVQKTSLKAYGDTRGTGGYWRDPATGIISKVDSSGKLIKPNLGVVQINSDESRLMGKDIIDVDEGWGDKDPEDDPPAPKSTTTTDKNADDTSKSRYRNRQTDKSGDADNKDYKYLNRGRDPGPRTTSPLKINGETMEKDYDNKDFRNFYGWVTDGNIKNINEVEDVLFTPIVKK